MTAFLKIDDCTACHRNLPWEWVPAVSFGARPLAGTGVWRSQLTDGLCPSCLSALEARHDQEKRASAMREALVQLFGGVKPYREFTFEHYDVTPGNQRAFERSKHFDPATDNLYLWGPCGVGKTHLAYAIARRWFEQARSVEIYRPPRLNRKLRMKEPPEEEAILDQLIGTQVFVLDDLGMGSDTAYSRQLLQEILDGRDFQDRAGLAITSKYSLGGLAEKWADDTLPSRLAGMCQVVEIRGVDRRLNTNRGAVTPRGHSVI